MSDLSRVQRDALRHMRNNGCRAYDDSWDRTQLALKRRGLVEWHSARKYGKGCWVLTPAGVQRATKLVDRIEESFQ